MNMRMQFDSRNRRRFVQSRQLWSLVMLAVGMMIVGLSLLGKFSIVAAQDVATQRGGNELFVPMVADAGMPLATPQATVQSGEELVYGLLGRVQLVEARNYLATSAGVIYEMVGETPALEVQIESIAVGPPPAQAKVWGRLVTPPIDRARPLLIVTGILPASAPAGPVAASAPVAEIRFELVNLHEGPGSGFGRAGQVTNDDVCDIVGRNALQTWWLLDCVDGREGWIDARLVAVTGSVLAVPLVEPVAVGPPTPLPVPTSVQPVPTPTPAAPQFVNWRTAIFDNSRLEGEPAAYADVERINFNWGTGSPHPDVPSDNFSVRFERTLDLESGFYRFQSQADDGVRVWVNNDLIINEWHGTTPQIYTAYRMLEGRTDIRVEYFEQSGSANLWFDYSLISRNPEWEARYYRGTTLSGEPVLQQQEARTQSPLDYNWGFGSPVPGELGTGNWSARWVGEFDFNDGTYIFNVAANGGVRLYLDNLLVIDAWNDGYKEISNRVLAVGRGRHTVRVEYFKQSGTALLRAAWNQ